MKTALQCCGALSIVYECRPYATGRLEDSGRQNDEKMSRLGKHSPAPFPAPHFFVILPSWIFQPFCWIRTTMTGTKFLMLWMNCSCQSPRRANDDLSWCSPGNVSNLTCLNSQSQERKLLHSGWIRLPMTSQRSEPPPELSVTVNLSWLQSNPWK